MTRRHRLTPAETDAMRRARTREIIGDIVTEDDKLLERLAQFEDELDLADAHDALEDPSNAQRVPWEHVRSRLGR